MERLRGGVRATLAGDRQRERGRERGEGGDGAGGGGAGECRGGQRGRDEAGGDGGAERGRASTFTTAGCGTRRSRAGEQQGGGACGGRGRRPERCAWRARAAANATAAGGQPGEHPAAPPRREDEAKATCAPTWAPALRPRRWRRSPSSAATASMPIGRAVGGGEPAGGAAPWRRSTAASEEHTVGAEARARSTYPQAGRPTLRFQRDFRREYRARIRTMELRRLRLLLELSRRGTVAAVADALDYSPSSVSVQLAELEREAGVKLLRRVGRNVALTPRAGGWPSTPRRRSPPTRRSAPSSPTLGGRAARARAGDLRADARRSRCCRATLGALARGGARPAGRGRPARDRAGARGPALARRRRRARDRLRPGAGAAPPRRRPPRPDPRARSCSRSPPTPARERRARSRWPTSSTRSWAAGHPGTGHSRGGREHLQRPRRLRARHPPPHRRRADPARAGLLRPGRDAAPGADRHRDAGGRRPRPIAEGPVRRTIFTAARIDRGRRPGGRRGPRGAARPPRTRPPRAATTSALLNQGQAP